MDEILKKIEYKRFYRRMRSKLKKRLRNGAQLSREVKNKYHLCGKTNYYHDIGLYRKKRSLYNIVIPEIFSVTNAPEQTLAFLERLKKELDSIEPCDLYISHEKTDQIGLTASFLFDQIIQAYIGKCKKRGIGIRLTGTVSDNREVNNFLLAFGLLDELKIKHHNLFPDKADNDYLSKYIVYKKPGCSINVFDAGNASSEIVDYFDKCFNENGFMIKIDPKTDLINCFGELIKNAEEHSGADITSWYVLGCYNKERHNCSFSVINSGYSFYESLNNNSSTAKFVLDQISEIVFSHLSFFKKWGIEKEQYDESIWTLMALQDGISSKRTETGTANTRGQGIMDVIEFIDQISSKEKENKLSIVSGNTLIAIDYTYKLVKKAVGNNNELRRVMSFNVENELTIPPDDKYVRRISTKFEGTIFSGSFIIDRSFLNQHYGRNK